MQDVVFRFIARSNSIFTIQWSLKTQESRSHRSQSFDFYTKFLWSIIFSCKFLFLFLCRSNKHAQHEWMGQ